MYVPSIRCSAERSLLAALEGGCQISMGVRSRLVEDCLVLFARLLSRDGSVSCETELRFSDVVDIEAAVRAGQELARAIKKQKHAEAILGPEGEEKRPITYGSAETAGIRTDGFSEE